jgi:hypothetical protein
MASSAMEASHMHRVRPVGATARRLVQGSALLLLLSALVAPLVAPPAHAADAAPGTVDPLRSTRLVRRIHLRVSGAAVSPLPVHELQRAHNDCALAIIARLHRRARAQGHTRMSLPAPATLARQLDLGPRGATLDALARTLGQLGWAARVQRAHQPLLPPAIALLEPGHYVLLTHATAHTVEYYDPLIGLVREPLPHYAARWTGNGVQLSTGDN